MLNKSALLKKIAIPVGYGTSAPSEPRSRGLDVGEGKFKVMKSYQCGGDGDPSVLAVGSCMLSRICFASGLDSIFLISTVSGETKYREGASKFVHMWEDVLRIRAILAIGSGITAFDGRWISVKEPKSTARIRLFLLWREN
jgi:hypothetical protein